MADAPHRVGVVMVAAGRGQRFGSELPKQFAPLGGRPVYQHALSVFESLNEVVEIVLVLPRDGLPPGMQPDWEGRARAVSGGAGRQDSVAAGLRALGSSIDLALVHDAARPFPPADAIRNLIERSIQHGGGLLALPAVDTIKQSNTEGCVAQTLDRNSIWLAQTPQAIRADHLPQLLELLDGESELTDESAALERLNVPVVLVAGSASNFKITHPDDLARAEAHLQTLSRD